MPRYRLFLSALFLFSLASCDHKPLAFYQLVSESSEPRELAMGVVETLTEIFDEYSIYRIGPDAHALSIGSDFPMDFESDQFLVSVDVDSSRVFLSIFENEIEFSASGLIFIGQVANRVKKTYPSFTVSHDDSSESKNI